MVATQIEEVRMELQQSRVVVITDECTENVGDVRVHIARNDLVLGVIITGSGSCSVE